jgi:class 3 adenylate cyclase
VTQTLTSGREAFDRHSWDEAYSELSSADQDGGLGPEDLELLADAAWWSGNVDESIDALERAYQGHIQAGSKTPGARVALNLAEREVRSSQFPVAQGWLARAERLLEDEPESAVHGWYEFMRAAIALQRDPEEAIARADRAIELGQAHGDPDVQNMALAFKGAAMARLGQVEEGLALVDEAAAAATSGELGVRTACNVYCFTMFVCRDVSDVRRSKEWTERAERYMARESVTGYPGACKVARAEVKRNQGRWVEAEDEARAACSELEKFRLLDDLGLAYNEIGEVRLRLGDLGGAEEAFTNAYQYGFDPQPGLALLHLARGDADEAARSLERSLGPGSDLLVRVHKLPARVEIALALSDAEGASAATAELEEIANAHENSIWTAEAATARGQLDLFTGDFEAAIPKLDMAWRSWRELDFPYESAKARTALARARQAAGDESGAGLELRAALTVFRDLGAGREVRQVEDLLGEGKSGDASTVDVRTFMFTDIVTSTDLIGLIGDEAWASLIRWHDRTLQIAFANHSGEVVNHTGDGFFIAFPGPGSSVDCAIDIQRSLRRHREEHGFAPSIRIGIHTTEATRTEGGYTGKGVHVAARVSGAAQADEILVSAASLAGLGGYAERLSEPRAVSLKGVPDPVEVVSVDWR